MKRSTAPGGVMEVQFRQALDEQRRKSSMDAAALQADLAKRLRLPGTTNGTIVRRQQQRPGAATQGKQEQQDKQQERERRQPLLGSKEEPPEPSSSSSQRAERRDVECASCTALNLQSETVCSVCGYYLAGVRQPAPTLAQRRGLVQAPAKIETISPAAWAVIEGRVDDRKDSFCPICMDAFKNGHEVLLSCSHMFHRHCLHAFEQFMGREARSCPICRTCNYQKRITQRGSKAFEVICANKLQAVWRGARARRTFRVGLRSYYRAGQGEGSRQRKKFYEGELSAYADRITRETETRGGVIDSVMQHMDRTLEESRQLDALFAAMLEQRLAQQAVYRDSIEGEDLSLATSWPRGGSGYAEDLAPLLGEAKSRQGARVTTEQQWQEACELARQRGHSECPICMCSTRSGAKGIIILSCSHIMHQQCVFNMERFLSEGVRGSCCVCRQVYNKRSVTQAYQLLE